MFICISKNTQRPKLTQRSRDKCNKGMEIKDTEDIESIDQE